jgi:hypothetical protein
MTQITIEADNIELITVGKTNDGVNDGFDTNCPVCDTFLFATSTNGIIALQSDCDHLLGWKIPCSQLLVFVIERT